MEMLGKQIDVNGIFQRIRAVFIHSSQSIGMLFILQHFIACRQKFGTKICLPVFSIIIFVKLFNIKQIISGDFAV